MSLATCSILSGFEQGGWPTSRHVFKSQVFSDSEKSCSILMIRQRQVNSTEFVQVGENKHNCFNTQSKKSENF